MEYSLDRDYLNGRIALIKDLILMGKNKDMGFILILMDNNMSDIGKMEKCMEKANTYSLMAYKYNVSGIIIIFCDIYIKI